MKRIVSLFLAVLLLFGMMSCGETAVEDTDQPTPSISIERS